MATKTCPSTLVCASLEGPTKMMLYCDEASKKATYLGQTSFDVRTCSLFITIHVVYYPLHGCFVDINTHLLCWDYKLMYRVTTGSQQRWCLRQYNFKAHPPSTQQPPPLPFEIGVELNYGDSSGVAISNKHVLWQHSNSCNLSLKDLCNLLVVLLMFFMQAWINSNGQGEVDWHYSTGDP